MSFYYHNHAFEFEVKEGLRGIDILLAETDPSVVHFQCDVYWVQYAGDDPAAFLTANSGRFSLIISKIWLAKETSAHLPRLATVI